ncbi:MAG: LytTR family transcriptional regulator DNA-binding domain-containing protein [Alloprevotella sp.]|nr:LytTR family transcriptional regulator DNA-binding domain-containing protein [Alloprevotella sp.]
MKTIVFNRRNELLRIPLLKAMFYEAYGNYSYAVFPNKQKVMLPVGLAQVEQLIANHATTKDPVFLRIGKRFIVNTEMIVQVNLGSQRLVLSDFDHPDNFSLPVNKEALKEIKRLYESNEIWK